jgi:hypothetical protein
MEWERERSSTSAAVTDPHPVNTGTDPEFELPADSFTPPPGTIGPGTTPTGQGTVYAMSGKQLLRTRDFSAASPAWVDIGPAQITTGRTFRDFILDPWRPHTTGLLSTFDGLYKSSDLDTTTPTWDMIMSPADILAETGDEITQLYWSKIMGSPNQDGYLAFIYETELGARLWCAKSTDAGATWAHVEVPDSGGITGIADSTPGAADIVPHTVGGGLVLYIAHSSGSFGKVYRSTSGGATWEEYADLPDVTGGAHTLHCPYDGNEAGDKFFVGTVISGDTLHPGRLYKFDGASITNVSPITDHGVGVQRTGVETYTGDSNIVYAWVERVLPDAGHTFWSSDDGGSTWTQAALVGFDATGTPASTSGFPYNGGQVYILTRNHIYFSTDGGATVTEKTGDSPIAGSTDFDSLDDFSRGVIVADWTE